MELERTPVERSQVSLHWESLCAGDDMHVKQRVALKVSHPLIQPLVEVFEVVPQASERFEIDA